MVKRKQVYERRKKNLNTVKGSDTLGPKTLHPPILPLIALKVSLTTKIPDLTAIITSSPLLVIAPKLLFLCGRNRSPILPRLILLLQHLWTKPVSPGELLLASTPP